MKGRIAGVVADRHSSKSGSRRVAPNLLLVTAIPAPSGDLKTAHPVLFDLRTRSLAGRSRRVVLATPPTR